MKTDKELKITQLCQERDELWQQFCHLPKKSSFSGLAIAGRLETVQQELNELETKQSTRYYPEIVIELG